MEINGLPLHALVVHAAVVLSPLSALAGLLYALVPRWRGWLRWPLGVSALAVVGVVWLAYLSGERLTEANQYGGPLAALVEVHEERAGVFRWVATGFAASAVAATVLHQRTGPLRWLLAGVVAVLAAGTVVYAVLTGDAGAQVAWYGTQG